MERADTVIALWYAVVSRSRRVAETIGGVAPVRHPAPIRTLVDVDVDLGQFDEVWAAAGHPHYVFPTTFDELVRITGGGRTAAGARQNA